MNSPILIACAHGTSNAQGAAEVNALRDAIAALRPGLDVREAYVDVQQPDLVDVVAGLPADPAASALAADDGAAARPASGVTSAPGAAAPRAAGEAGTTGASAVVVPLLLSVGYHVKVDIAKAVKSRPGTVAAAPLGPDPRLAALLDQRLREAGVTDNDSIVLAAAGSSNPNAAVSVEELAGQLGALRSNRIVPAYGASAKPSVPEAVAMLPEEAAGGAGAGESAGGVSVGGRGVVASYLLAPGFFHDQLAKAGADLVTEPLLPSPVLAEIALERYDAALAAHAVNS